MCTMAEAALKAKQRAVEDMVRNNQNIKQELTQERARRRAAEVAGAEDSGFLRQQMEALLKEKAQLAQENASLLQENRSLSSEVLLLTQQLDNFKSPLREFAKAKPSPGRVKSPEEIEATLKAKEKEFKDTSSDTAWKELSKEEQVAINRWSRVGEHPDYGAVLDKIRQASADTSDWLKNKMSIKHGEDDLNTENVLIMPSNTERDNRVTDSAEDVEKVGGGSIGSQKRGSANATDASYFVPINALASGWDGEVTDDPDDPENKKCSASRYNYSDDPRDQFVMLSSFTIMLSESARRR